MVIGLAKVVLCFFLCLNLTRAYQQQKHSIGRNDLYAKYQVTARPLTFENKLRHSRYPKFGEVMTRIENFSKDPPVEISSKPTYNKKIRHKNWGAFYKSSTTTTTTTTPEPLFDELTYGEYEDEDNDRSDYDDDYEDEDDDEDDEDDEIDDEEYALFDKVEDDMQAEEPTERSSTISAKPMSSFSEFKWNNYGTRTRVEQSRQQHFRQSPEQAKVDAFLDHYLRATKQGKCQQPLPKVIPVKKEHPHLKKNYTPSCTVLHRCSEDTGCCNKNTRCQYKSRVLVQLYFYVQEGAGLSNKVEKLEFYNHTECECRSISSDELPEDPAPDFSFKPSRQFNTPQTVKRCTCPALFEDARYSNKCACDCAPGNEDCLRLKKGKEHFNLIERICIQEGRCGVPICEHGIYSMSAGKCPTKKEKLEEYSRVELNFG